MPKPKLYEKLLQVRLTTQQVAGLEKKALNRGMSVSELIRVLIRKELDKKD